MSNKSVVIDVAIKLGGSSITDKQTFETLIPEHLTVVAGLVKAVCDSGLKCAVVHGAGSFGHHQAKMYEVNKGFQGEETTKMKKEKMFGFSLTRQSVTKLNKMVVDSLLSEGVPAVACSPGSSWRTKDRVPISWPSEVLSGLLTEGWVPVLHGDCCLDTTLGCCILSGDTIIQAICSNFDVSRVVFFTDVKGVYDRPPNEPGASLLNEISVRSDGSLVSRINTSQCQFDVTGGIELKLKTACSIATQSKGKCPVVICGVRSLCALAACTEPLSKENKDFTVISLDTTS